MTLLLESLKTKFVQLVVDQLNQLGKQKSPCPKHDFEITLICTSNSLELTGYRQIEKDGQ